MVITPCTGTMVLSSAVSNQSVDVTLRVKVSMFFPFGFTLHYPLVGAQTKPDMPLQQSSTWHNRCWLRNAGIIDTQLE